MTKRTKISTVSTVLMAAMCAVGCSRSDYFHGYRGDLDHGNVRAARTVPAERPTEGTAYTTKPQFEAPRAFGGGPSSQEQARQQDKSGMRPPAVEPNGDFERAPFPDGVTPRAGIMRE